MLDSIYAGKSKVNFLSDSAKAYIGLMQENDLNDLKMTEISALIRSGQYELTAKLLRKSRLLNANNPDHAELIAVADEISELKFKQGRKQALANFVVLHCSSCENKMFIPPGIEARTWLASACPYCGDTQSIKKSQM